MCVRKRYKNMKYLITLLLFPTVLHAAEVPMEELYDKRISRLYTCGKFFNIVGGQRKDAVEKQRYQELSKSSIELANNLIDKHQNELKGKYKKLKKKYNRSGGKAAIQLVKNIGNSPSVNLFGQYVEECYTYHEEESLANTVDELSEKFSE